VNIRIILAVSTVIGIMVGDLLAQQTEARAYQNFSRHYIAQTTIPAEEDSYQSPRKERKLVKSSTLIKTGASMPRSIFDLLNENEALPKEKLKKPRNSTAATAPIKNQLSRGAARRAEIRKYLAAEAARQAGEIRKKPEEVFELFNGGELKSKSPWDDSMAVTAVDADKLKKRLAEKAARQAEIKNWLAAEETLTLEKQRQAEETEGQRLTVAESRTEANLTDGESIPAGERVRVGERDARVPMIRARMVKLGFLSEENSLAWMLGHPADQVSNPSDLESILDKELSKAIKAFQKANDIEQTGRIDKATVVALNVPALAAKQQQVEEAERQRLAEEAAAKQRQVEEERKVQEAALALEKQRQAEEAERLAHNRKVASLDSASEANEALSKSCNKAKSIVGKYGFEDIQTKSCNGKIYHFSATREGKKFSVKINALTSALTEIKKVISYAPE
jgi:peptidoglycan hydrolase-like protein with peptidoglycan-binding domain